MPVQVSYKKQFVFLFLLTLTFLAVVEVLVNVWLYYFYRCDFEDNEIFKNSDHELNRKVCIESLDFNFNERIGKNQRTNPDNEKYDGSVIYINSEGFRSPEFSKEKPEDTYRIFIMGGSTSFGLGVLDHQTFPAYLQQKYDQMNLNFTVEVINTGRPGAWSSPETKLIKNRLLNYEPDLFIVFDGYNDMEKATIKKHPFATPQHWKDRWTEICDLGRQEGFSTMVTIQPTVGTGAKKLTEQEYQWYIKKQSAIIIKQDSDYAEKLDELKNNCTLTADLRNIFDDILGPIYYDFVHVGPKGNRIIAENFYQLSFPIVMKQSKNIVQNKDGQVSDSTLEIKDQLYSKNFDFSSEQFFNFIRDVILPYKTPKVLQLIFE